MVEVSNNFKLRLLNVGLILMFALPIFPSNIRPYIIAFFGISVLFSNSKKSLRFNSKPFLINGGIYLLMVVSLLHSDNIEYGLNKLETMASLIVFPLIFLIFPRLAAERLHKNVTKYLFVYFISIVLFNVISFIYHADHYRETIFVHYPTVNRIAQGPFNIHPIYLSTHICTAILFSFFILKKLKSRAKIVIMILLDLILLFFLFILLKKGLIIVLGIVSVIFVLFQRSKKLLYLGLILITLNIITIISIPQYRAKFLELTKIEDVSTGGVTSTNIRYTIYRSAINKIITSPLLGYGIGDHKDELLSGLKNESEVLYNQRYNSHNQYISFALALGLVGLLFFLYFLGFNLVLAIRFNNQILILLIIFYGLIMLFENILERENGVVYFSFFIGYFGLMSHYKYQEHQTKKIINK